MGLDRKSTRLNSSHLVISYAVFCLKKKKKKNNTERNTHRKRIVSAYRIHRARVRPEWTRSDDIHDLLSVLFFVFFFFFFFNDTATTEIYTLSLHDALPI